MNSIKNKNIIIPIWLFGIFLAGNVSRTSFTNLFIGFLLQFVCYLFLYQSIVSAPDRNANWQDISKQKGLSIVFFLLIAHLLVVITLPNLSDDVYRFVWDGVLTNNGLHPLTATPTMILAQQKNALSPSVILHLRNIYPHLNSPNYYTIYPTVLQFIFYCSSFFSNNNLIINIYIIKCVFLLCNIGSFFTLRKILVFINVPAANAVLFSAFPLCLHELSGNAHGESVAIFFTLLAIYSLLLEKYSLIKRGWLSSFFLSLAIATKLLPLVFLPFFAIYYAKYFDIKQQIIAIAKYTGLVLSLSFLLLLPFFAGLSSHFGESLNLYFQKFEFNASLYYGFRWLGTALVGYNLIYFLGPLLSLLSGLSILLLARQFFLHLRAQSLTPQRFFSFLLFALSIYFLCATTVHPWYLSTLIALAVLAEFRYPFVWAAMAMMTYISYSNSPFFENLGVVMLEYSFLAIGLYLEKEKIGRTLFLSLPTNDREKRSK